MQLHYGDSLDMSRLENEKLLEDLAHFRKIIKEDFTYEALYKDFDQKDEVLQDIILEDFKDFEQVSAWQEEKLSFIEMIENLIANNQTLSLEQLHAIAAAYKVLFYHLEAYFK